MPSFLVLLLTSCDGIDFSGSVGPDGAEVEVEVGGIRELVEEAAEDQACREWVKAQV